jgi:hypothetical protein
MQVGSVASCGDVISDKITDDSFVSWQLVFDEVGGGKVWKCFPVEFLCLQQESVG